MCFDSTAFNIRTNLAACDDSNQALQDSVVPGMCTMLWSEKCSHMCYGPSSGSIIGLSSFMAIGYTMIDASFILQISVLKSLRNLSTFLESSQQLHDDYCELVELVILSLRDISPFAYDLWPKTPGPMHKAS